MHSLVRVHHLTPVAAARKSISYLGLFSSLWTLCQDMAGCCPHRYISSGISATAPTSGMTSKGSHGHRLLSGTSTITPAHPPAAAIVPAVINPRRQQGQQVLNTAAQQRYYPHAASLQEQHQTARSAQGPPKRPYVEPPRRRGSTLSLAPKHEPRHSQSTTIIQQQQQQQQQLRHQQQQQQQQLSAPLQQSSTVLPGPGYGASRHPPRQRRSTLGLSPMQANTSPGQQLLQQQQQQQQQQQRQQLQFQHQLSQANITHPLDGQQQQQQEPQHHHQHQDMPATQLHLRGPWNAAPMARSHRLPSVVAVAALDDGAAFGCNFTDSSSISTSDGNGSISSSCRSGPVPYRRPRSISASLAVASDSTNDSPATSSRHCTSTSTSSHSSSSTGPYRRRSHTASLAMASQNSNSSSGSGSLRAWQHSEPEQQQRQQQQHDLLQQYEEQLYMLHPPGHINHHTNCQPLPRQRWPHELLVPPPSQSSAEPAAAKPAAAAIPAAEPAAAGFAAAAPAVQLDITHWALSWQPTEEAKQPSSKRSRRSNPAPLVPSVFAEQPQQLLWVSVYQPSGPYSPAAVWATRWNPQQVTHDCSFGPEHIVEQQGIMWQPKYLMQLPSRPQFGPLPAAVVDGLRFTSNAGSNNKPLHSDNNSSSNSTSRHDGYDLDKQQQQQQQPAAATSAAQGDSNSSGSDSSSWFDYLLLVHGDFSTLEHENMFPNHFVHCGDGRTMFDARDAGDVASFVAEAELHAVESHCENLIRLVWSRSDLRPSWVDKRLEQRWGKAALNRLGFGHQFMSRCMEKALGIGRVKC